MASLIMMIISIVNLESATTFPRSTLHIPFEEKTLGNLSSPRKSTAIKDIHSQSRKSTIKGIDISGNAVKETRLVEARHWGLKVNGTWTVAPAADNQIFDKISVTR